MCLKITPTGAAMTVRLQNTTKPIKVFKILDRDGTTYYRETPWDRKGPNVAAGTLASLGAREVNGGAIHAFRTKAAVAAWAKTGACRRAFLVVPAYVLPRHLVAIGRFEKGDDSICATTVFGSFAAARRYAKGIVG